jgi:transposase-like protein
LSGTKGHLHDICQAEPRTEAETAFDFFVETYGVKWDKAVVKLVKARDTLLTFYDYPAEHWEHIRTLNPIKSTCATVPASHETHHGCLRRKTGLGLVTPVPVETDSVRARGVISAPSKV